MEEQKEQIDVQGLALIKLLVGMTLIIVISIIASFASVHAYFWLIVRFPIVEYISFALNLFLLMMGPILLYAYLLYQRDQAMERGEIPKRETCVCEELAPLGCLLFFLSL